MDFLGSIAGVLDLLQYWAKIILGGYLAFHTKVINIGLLYSVQ